MADELKLHDVVALTDEVPATHHLTHQPLQLRRGQVGTVVMPLTDGYYQVEFSDAAGRAYAMLPLRESQLIVLRDEPEPLPV